MARKVYSAAAPGRLPDTSRSKGYTSRYMENRWKSWELALKEAELNLKLDASDYKARVKLYSDSMKAQQDALADARKQLADYQEGIIDENRLRERRNSAAENSALGKGGTTYTSSTGVTSGTSVSKPKKGDGETILNNAAVRADAQSELSEGAKDLVDNAISALPSTGAPTDVVAAALQNYESRLIPGIGLSQTDRDLGRTVVLEGALADIVTNDPDLDIDAMRLALANGTWPGMDPNVSDAVKGSYLAANQIGGGDQLFADLTPGAPERTTKSGTSSRTSVSTRAVPDFVTIDGVEADPEVVAEIEARIADLEANLVALEVPEMERRSLIEEAQGVYAERFGLDVSVPSVSTRIKEREQRPSTSDLFSGDKVRTRQTRGDLRPINPNTLRQALVAGGYITETEPEPKAEPEVETETNPDLSAFEAETPQTREGLIEDLREAAEPTLAQQSAFNVAKASKAGAAIAMAGGTALQQYKDRDDMQPVLQLWNQSGEGAKAADLVAQVREAYTSDEEALRGITLLFALQAEQKKDSLLLDEEGQ